MNTDASMAAMDLRMEYPDLSSLEAGLGAGRLDLAAIFPDRAGRGAKKHNQKRIKNLGLAVPLLSRMLWDQEIIEYAAIGVYVSTAEMLLNGVWSQFSNQYLILLTNSRLIFIHIDTRGNPQPRFLHQMLFDRIKAVKSGLFSNFQFKLAGGKTILFQAMNKQDRTALKDRLSRRIAQSVQSYAPAAPADAGSYENLCTNCFRAVPLKTYICPFCQTEFRTPMQAALRSLVLPGWGDLYMKQGFLAVLRMVAVPVLYLAIIIGAVEDPQLGPFALIPVFIIIGAINAFSALATYLVSKKGLVPLR